MPKIGIIAGGGDLPSIIAREALAGGFEVYTAGFEGFTCEEMKKISSACEFFKLGKIQAPWIFLKRTALRK